MKNQLMTTFSAMRYLVLVIILSLPASAVAVDLTLTADATAAIEDNGEVSSTFFHAIFSAAPSADTQVTTSIATGSVNGAGSSNDAIKGTDYNIVYKIGGSLYGKGKNFNVSPQKFLAGTSTIPVLSGTGSIAQYSTITFPGDTTPYVVTNSISGQSGNITISPALSQSLTMGATLTRVLPTTFTINQLTLLEDATTFSIKDGNYPIPAGSTITFPAPDHLITYTTVSGLNALSGMLTVYPGISSDIATPNGKLITVTPPPMSGYKVGQGIAEPLGTTSVIVTGDNNATTQFAAGDVIQFGDFTQKYVVVSYLEASSVFTLTFKKFPGTGGLVDALSGTTLIKSHFNAVYSAPNASRIILDVPQSSTRIDYAVIPIADLSAEGVEKVTLSLVPNLDYTLISPSTKSVEIADDDVTIELDTSKHVNGIEWHPDPDGGDGSYGSFFLKITSPNSTGFIRDIVIPFTTSGAVLNTDFTIVGQTVDNEVVLDDGSSNKTSLVIQVKALADLDTNTESLVLTLDNSTSYNVQSPITDTIQLKDPSGTVSITASDISGRERPSSLPQDTASFTVSIARTSGPTPENVKVYYSINASSTATEGTDFQTLTDKFVIIPANASTADIVISPVDNAIFEEQENLTLTLTADPAYLLSSTTSATITLLDDEPKLKIEATTNSASEGGATAQLKISFLSPASLLDRDLLVPLTYSGASPSDHNGPASVTISAGTSEATFSIKAEDDALVELVETLTATITNNTAYHIDTGTATIQLNDNEPTVSITTVNLRGSATEGGATAQLSITLVPASIHPLTLSLTYSGASASDHNAEASITIDPNTTAKIIEITAADDDLYETTETLTATITSNSNVFKLSTAAANVQLVDNEPGLSIAVVSGRDSAREGGDKAQVTITLNKTSIHPIAVSLTYTGTNIEGADYSAQSTVTIDALTLTKTVDIEALTDTKYEGPETLTATIINSSPAHYSIIQATANVTLLDDAPVMSLETVTGHDRTREGDIEADYAQIKVSYPGTALNRAVDVFLTYSGADTSDHNGLLKVTIPALSKEVTIKIGAILDAIAESAETLTATISSNAAYSIGTPSAVVYLEDNSPTISIEKVVEAAKTKEGSSVPAAFKISYSGTALGRDVEVKLSYPTTGSTAVVGDLTATPLATIKILAGNTFALLPLLATNDGDAENTETFTCEIAANTAAYFINDDKKSAVIEIEDTAPALTLTVDGEPFVIEGDTAAKNFIVTCTPAPIKAFEVNYTITGKATAGTSAGGENDYKTLSGKVTIPKGVTTVSSTTTIPITTFTDSAFDPDENVTITLTEASPKSFTYTGDKPPSSSITILDAIPGVVSITSDAATNVYTAGSTILISIKFSQKISVTGSPLLLLDTGLNDTDATYDSSSDAFTLVFKYTVRPTDKSSDLDYASTLALRLNSGSILTTVGSKVVSLTLPTPGTLGSLGFNKNLIIDGGVDGKPAPGAVSKDGGGGCGLGSGFATMLLLFMALGIRLRIFPKP